MPDGTQHGHLSSQDIFNGRKCLGVLKVWLCLDIDLLHSEFTVITVGKIT